MKKFTLFAFLLILSMMSVAEAATWTKQAVDDPKLFSNYMSRAIDIDSDENPHIVYGQDHLYLAYKDGSSWCYETVDLSSGVGEFASIAVDTSDSNRIHISYYDSVNEALKYATGFSGSSGSWVCRTIDGVSDKAGQYTSIAVDSSKAVHISYYDETNTHLKYATKNTSGDWSYESIDNNDNTGQYTSIAVDSSNNLHISYYDAENKNLKYATKPADSDVWLCENADDNANNAVGQYTSIAVDSSNNVHISYYDANNKDLKYVTNESGDWSNTDPNVIDSDDSDTNYDVGQYTSIAVDSSNNVHISYYDANNKDLKYVMKNDASSVWSEPKEVDSADDVGQYTSIAVDSSNNVHISYHYRDESHQTLKYVNLSSLTTTKEEVDSVGLIDRHTSIALDSSDFVHISYCDVTANRDLKYATNSSGKWINSTIDNADNVGEYSSIAVDSSNNVHISYYDANNKDLKYVMKNNASVDWSESKKVDSEGDVGQYTSIAVDSSDYVHISYYDVTNKVLKYVTNEFSDWYNPDPKVIDSDDSDTNYDVGQYTSIAVDSSDNVHISYYDANNKDLKYVMKNASGVWSELKKVDSEGDVGQYTSIAVDSSDYVHISYYDATATAMGLKYATNLFQTPSNVWTCNLLDTKIGIILGQFTSIAVDSSDYVHISYYDVTSKNLKYTTNISGVESWDISVMDSDDNVGRYNSIAVSKSGYVYISYIDSTNYDLKFATNYEFEDDSINPGGGYDCFITTAVCGSAVEPYIKILRNFRDIYLLSCKLGSAFVTTYYTYSPPMAHFIAKHDILRTIVRWSLLPLIAFGYASLHYGIAITAAIVIFVSALVIIIALFCFRKLFRSSAI